MREVILTSFAIDSPILFAPFEPIKLLLSILRLKLCCLISNKTRSKSKKVEETGLAMVEALTNRLESVQHPELNTFRMGTGEETV